LTAVPNDPMRVLREYNLEPLRRGLRTPGSRVLVLDEHSAREQWSAAGVFDAAWIELASVACLDLPALATRVVQALRPGARLVCLLPNGPSLASVVRRALRGSDGGPDPIGEFRVMHLWRAAFGGRVEWQQVRGLGVLLPAAEGWGRSTPLALAVRGAAEHAIAKGPWFREQGAWVLLEGVRL
jgi:hypothetical protein